MGRGKARNRENGDPLKVMAENEKNPRGRPRFELTQQKRELLLSLAQVGATNEEIATAIGCSADTVERRFQDFLRVGRNAGNVSLRRSLFANALQGNPQLLIFLAKNHLGMRERMDLTSGDEPIMSLYGVDFSELDPPAEPGEEGDPQPAPVDPAPPPPPEDAEPGDALGEGERDKLFADPEGGQYTTPPPTNPGEVNPPEPPAESDPDPDDDAGDEWKGGD